MCTSVLTQCTFSQLEYCYHSAFTINSAATMHIGAALRIDNKHAELLSRACVSSQSNVTNA